jgi:hypothetical protein
MSGTLASFQSQAWVAAFWIAIGGVVGIFIRQIVPWKKQAADAQAMLRDAEAELRHDLMRRVEKLERDRERERLYYDSELRIERHGRVSVTACFDALLMLLKTNPDKVQESVAVVEEMRGKQIAAEAEEKAIIRAALIANQQNYETTEEAA